MRCVACGGGDVLVAAYAWLGVLLYGALDRWLRRFCCWLHVLGENTWLSLLYFQAKANGRGSTAQ